MKHLLASALILSMSGPLHAAPIQASRAVTTESGQVSGTDDGTTLSYLGIPYAAPPTGPLRWQPPKAVKPWTETRVADHLGDSCLQNPDLGAFATPGGSEDCLYLNVYADRQGLNAARAEGRKLPVFVWIHGGGLAVGQGGDYDPRRIASEGKSIVVTMNYRLGILGFFSHPAIDKEGHASSNYGHMDQTAALQWVHRNISSFGGDPARVTLSGESSGGTSVLAQVIAPSAKDTFQRAVMMSGSAMMLRWPHFGAPTPLDAAEKKGADFADAVGCGGADAAACLRALPANVVLAHQKPYLIAQTVIDGEYMPQHPADALKTGDFNDVSIISGTNRNEGRFFVGFPENETGVAMSAETYPAAVSAFFGKDLAQKVVAAYPLAQFNNPSEAYAAATTDYLFACGNLKLADTTDPKAKVRVYEFADETAPSYLKPTSFSLGSAHTFELAYLFPGFHGGELGQPVALNDMQEKLASDMTGFWTDSTGAEWNGWPQYKAAGGEILRLRLPHGDTIGRDQFAAEHKCNFWDGTGIY